MKRVITLPRMSFYSYLYKQLLENLGAEVLLPPSITEKTIKLGVKHSSLMMCYPFKVTLGSFIESLELAKKKGVKLTYFGAGTSTVCKRSCRFPQFFEIQKKICEDIGYEFDTIFIERKAGNIVLGILAAFKKVNPQNSYFKIIKELIKAVRQMYKEEKKQNFFNPKDTKSVRVGIVGESYTVMESSINYDIFNKLKKLGVNVHTFIHYSDELKLSFGGGLPQRFIKEGRRYYKGMFRAHGDASFYSLYYYKHHNFDGVIHLMPLSCMPEATASMIMDITAKRLNLPLYRFEIDETNSEANVNTRIEAAVELFKRKRGIT